MYNRSNLSVRSLIITNSSSSNDSQPLMIYSIPRSEFLFLNDKHDVLFENQKLVRTFNDYVNRDQDQTCVHPVLNIHDAEIMKWYYPLDPIVCSPDPEWVLIQNGMIIVNPEVIEKYGDIKCDIKFINWNGDFEISFSEVSTIHQNSSIYLKQDFFRVQCVTTSSINQTSYSNLYAGVSFKPELLTGHDNAGFDGLGLDVFILGMDSMSQLAYLRTLPKTVEYFTTHLNGVIFDGYNILGEGTPAALIPILTGKTETELPDVNRDSANASFVDDVYPFIWNKFKERGYITAFAEDYPGGGTWTWRMTGFNEQPTDYYLRPFYLAAEQEDIHNHRKYCLGSKRRSQVFLGWLKDIFTTYPKQNKFIMSMLTELTHEDNNLAQTMDDDIKHTLQALNECGLLSNTLLILMADHGARYGGMRDTLQGKQEERRPFLGISLPNWVQQKYPNIVHHLKSNSKRLTSPFDIHQTLMNILTCNHSPSNQDKPKRGLSLFSEIPKSRSCADADIETHYCACLKWKLANISEPTVHKAAEIIVRHINNLTHAHNHLCSVLTLKNITRVASLVPEKDLVQLIYSHEHDGLIPDHTSHDMTELYQLSIITTPGNGHFECTVAYLRGPKTWIVKSEGMSRINKYGSDSRCIYNDATELLKYCYCKNQTLN